jgi:hypothetical protein
MTKDTTPHAHGFAPQGIAAPFLDTQTLGGDDGYFHTENAPTHATDGSAKGQSPETPLVKASQGGAAAAEDDLDSKTKAELVTLAENRGVEIDARASKATILEALRG